MQIISDEKGSESLDAAVTPDIEVVKTIFRGEIVKGEG